MEKNEQLKVAGSKDNTSADNTQLGNCVDGKPSIKFNKKPLTPYQKYKQSKNQNGKKYFEFYDDIKVYTHNIYDW